MTGGLLGDLADWGVTIAVDPAMPEGVMELRTSPDRPGTFVILPGTEDERVRAEVAAREHLTWRLRETVRQNQAAHATQEAHRQWRNPPLPSPDSITRPTEGDAP